MITIPKGKSAKIQKRG